MIAVYLFPEPSQLVCDPVLNFGPLYVRQEAQYPTVGLCHRVDLVVETPVDLPLREEQLCPLAFSVKYLRGVSHKFGPSCGVSWSRTSACCRWSASRWSASSSRGSTSSSRGSTSASRCSSTSSAAAAAYGRDVGSLCGRGCCHDGCNGGNAGVSAAGSRNGWGEVVCS